MAPWYTGGHHSFHGTHGSNRGSISGAGSTPSSPALTPSFGNQSHHSSSLNLSSGTQTPADHEPLDPMDPLFNESSAAAPTASSSGAVTPFSSGATTPYSTGGGGYFPNSHYIPLEIILDNDQLVLRGAGGDSNPAYLSGSVVLTLTESTNIKELTMELRGKAKVQFNEGSGAGARSHHHTHLVLSHDWSFLEGHKRHSHTLKAGRHVFPFNLMLEGGLPSSIRTYTNDAYISYKLRAHAIRSTFASNFTAHKTFTLLRTYTTEALEFNQTLEIENTWPGKVMYCLTLPHKAFAAGDEIPVSIKFMPLAKGVRVVSVSSIIKEYTLVHTRHSQHPDARVAATAKHEIKRGRAYAVSTDIDRPPKNVDDHGSRPGSAANSAPSSPTRQPVSLPPTASTQRDSSQHRTPGPRNRPLDSYFPAMATDEPVASGSNAEAGASTASLVTRESSSSSVTTDIELGDDEVDTHISIPIPTWTTPSHNVHPVFVSHKIKWSCSISNADGHVSELRCALPILIIANPLLAEAHAAGAQTRALLFGGAAAAEAQQIDLPSYNNHVYDRVASLEPGMSNAGFTTRSVHQTPIPSPSDGTPPHSRPPSRPASPTRGLSRGEYAGDVPPRPQLSSWADSELLLSLGALGRDGSNPASQDNSPTATPPDSRTPSRPGSRSGFRGRNSNPSSRAGSRASSPERGADDILRPEPTRRQSHGLHGLFHMPAIKPMKAFTAIGGGKPGPHARGDASPPNGLQRSSQSFTNVQHANHTPAGRSNLAASSQLNSRSSGDLYNQRFSAAAGPSGLRTPGFGPPDTPTHPEIDPLSQVPSYAIASRGFLGGGVTPLNSGLPTYDEAEGQRGAQVPRARSEGDLTALAAAADEPREE